MLLLLCRWAFADCKRHGAFTFGGSTHSCRELVITFLSVVNLPQVSRAFKAYAVAGMLPLHPRPVSSAFASFHISCSVGGVWDFRRLQELCVREGTTGRAVANKWANALDPTRNSAWSWQIPAVYFISLCIKKEG